MATKKRVIKKKATPVPKKKNKTGGTRVIKKKTAPQAAGRRKRVLTEADCEGMTLEALEKEMTLKHIDFCRHYLTNYNATQAAISAGYGRPNAKKVAWAILQRPDIQAYLSRIKQQLTQSTIMSATETLERLSVLARANKKDVYQDNGQLVPVHEMPEDVAYALQSVEVIKHGEDSDAPETTIKYKEYDKLRALDMLGRHHAIYEKSETEEENRRKNQAHQETVELLGELITEAKATKQE